MQLIENEIPSGAINGVNLVFTVSHQIQQIDEVWADGEIVFSPNYVVSGNTITFTIAPTIDVFIDYYTSPPTLPPPTPGVYSALQKPKILDLNGRIIRVAHPDITGRDPTYLSAPFTAGATSVTVRDNQNLANGNYILVGNIGDSQSEEVSINGAVTRGTALTITNSTKFSHELDAPVTRLYERSFKIYGAP